MNRLKQNVFIKGAIQSEFIATSITKHQAKKDIGAHQLFLGQVRADNIQNKKVIAIDYSAYEEMAVEKLDEIRENTFQKYSITCMHIYHSLGRVEAGELCLFVFVSAPRRKVTYEALEYIVEAIKKEVPIFGKEILEDQSYTWKKN
ncbi:molybdenum cofactor biosynthesis protein MoaE [Flavobacterium columnare]|uniref:Molybdopterin synthase catalytic subunit n=2 Tax=Flavobacterium columnare TaxID=996 RepID=A0AAI8CF87_9FLAO|nr:molybdenum cofactor biosynthesis protein MoaE [Flavobacterium columnare]AMO19619.1 molybdenum cofactor biosynthesis protein MoaE [Flavobacterium columnare]AUX17552.1 molybdopterin converting factor [Flavobacterium columnare]MEB3800390.1 molybdenum cofactor biosynthesis protein MoaE [Flavobacterium columnare]QOG56606.1 molybdenum cofactor biosynthesis protein MoaE [Flavobacterium columnare]QOG59331.1 molybdenum cofactor biosynthesis protein MoaE [Flavobacterium columnare]